MPEICCSLKVTIFFKALFLKTVLGNLFLHFHGTQLYCRSFPSLVQWVCLFYIPICCCLWRVGEAWEMPETSILCIITLEARPLQAREVEGKKRGLYTDAGLDSPQLRASTTTRPYKMSMFFFLPPYSSLMHRVVIEGRPWVRSLIVPWNRGIVDFNTMLTWLILGRSSIYVQIKAIVWNYLKGTFNPPPNFPSLSHHSRARRM